MTHLCIPPSTSIPPSRRSKNTSRYQVISPRFSSSGGASASKGGEDQSLVVVELRHRDESPALALESAVIGFLEERDADQRSIVAIGPAVIGTRERGGVAGIGSAQPVAAMAAHVEEGVNLAVRVAHDQDRVLPYVGREEVARLRDLALVAEEEPAASEDPLELLLVDLSLDEDATADQSVLGIDEIPDVPDHVRPPAMSSAHRA